MTSTSRTIAAALANESAAESQVAAALQEYLAALEIGVPIARGEFLAKHQAIAPQLLECLKSLDLVHAAARELDPPAAQQYEQNFDFHKLPLGDFQIIREIGRGGMGVVYEAMQLSLGRKVAVKVLPFVASLDPKYLQRFKNEARSAAALHHAHIVPVYAVGSERGVHFYAMQLIEGFSLADVADRRREISQRGKSSATVAATMADSPMPRHAEQTQAGSPSSVEQRRAPSADVGHAAQSTIANLAASTLSNDEKNPLPYFRSIAEWIRQAASALDHAHEFGVIHRDVKPANLLVDERNNIWITDFGLAMFNNDLQLTRTGDMVGTLRYMSPEQASGDRVVMDHRADIYGLGATLYELLTLEYVVSAQDAKGALRQILQEEPKTPRAIDKRIPLELETIVLKAIAKAPKDRYATAAQMAEDLERWLDDKPIRARRPTLAERAARWGRRNQGLVAATAAFSLLACIGLLVSTFFIAQQKSKATTAYNAEVQARQAADASFREAWRAVDAFRQLSEEEFADKPMLFQARRRFLATALDFYNKFLEQRRNDPAVQQELAETKQQVERIMGELSLLEKLGPLMLLDDSHVQDDLQLSAESRTEISAALDEELLNVEQLGNSGFTKVLTAFIDRLNPLLTDAQHTRLQQIALQQRGPFAFKSPEVIAALSLTSDQLSDINRIIEEQRPDKRGGPGGPDFGGPGHGGPPPDFLDHGFGKKGPPKFKGERKERGPPEFDDRGPPDGPDGPRGELFTSMKRTTELILEILTPTQRSKWREMIGEPFPYDLHWRPFDILPF